MYGCPVIILISMSNVTGIQYMVPTGMYSQYSASVIAGSCVNFLINMFLIPRYGAMGAIIASVIAEATVTGIQMFMIRKKVNFHFFSRSYRIYLLATVLMSLAVLGMKRIMPVSAAGTIAEVLTGMAVYFLTLFAMKEELCMKVLNTLRNRKGAANA